MNKYAWIVGLAVTTNFASAATTHTVIDFGLAGTTAMVGTINQFATTNASGETATTMVLNTTAGSDSGIRFTTSGTTGIFSAGGAGSFSPAGSVSYTTGSSVVAGWIANEQVAYGDVWQGVANASGGSQTISLTFSGLAANTDYTFKFLSGRANAFGSTNTGTYAMIYDGSGVSGGGTTQQMQGSAAGLNATNYTWTFSTGSTPGNAVIDLSGAWNVNAITITAIPESSSALLGGLGMLALLRRRRN
jgi:hypothetical protein